MEVTLARKQPTDISNLVAHAGKALVSRSSVMGPLLWIIGILVVGLTLTLGVTAGGIYVGLPAWSITIPLLLLLLVIAAVGAVIALYVRLVWRGETEPLRSEQWSLEMKRLEVTERLAKDPRYISPVQVLTSDPSPPVSKQVALPHPDDKGKVD